MTTADMIDKRQPSRINGAWSDTESTTGSQDPLSEAPGLDGEDIFAESSRTNAEEATVECMNEAGFEYIPRNTTDFDSSFVPRLSSAIARSVATRSRR